MQFTPRPAFNKAGLFYKGESVSYVACDNCDWEGDDDDLAQIDDIFERVEPGEIMPAGQCPNCGSLCHAESRHGGVINEHG